MAVISGINMVIKDIMERLYILPPFYSSPGKTQETNARRQPCWMCLPLAGRKWLRSRRRLSMINPNPVAFDKYFHEYIMSLGFFILLILTIFLLFIILPCFSETKTLSYNNFCSDFLSELLGNPFPAEPVCLIFSSEKTFFKWVLFVSCCIGSVFTIS